MNHEGQSNAKVDNVIDFGNAKMVLEHSCFGIPHVISSACPPKHIPVRPLRAAL